MVAPAAAGRVTGRHIFNLCALAAGGVGLWFLLRQLGAAEVGRIALGVRGWFVVVLLLALLGLLCDAAALHVLMRPEARMVSFARVVAAQASGLAVNLLTPGAKLGEATKVTLLADRAPRARVVSSVVLFNLCYLYLQAAVVMVGVPLSDLLLDLPPALERRIGIGSAAVLALAVAVAALVHRGVLDSLLGGAARVRIVSPETRRRLMERLAGIDRHLRELHIASSGSTRAGMALVFAAKALSWAELYVILHALGARPGAVVMLAIVSATIVIDEISAIVPFGIGLADAGNYLVFGVLGLTPIVGATLTLVRRGRNAVMAILGLATMLGLSAAEHVALARRRARRR